MLTPLQISLHGIAPSDALHRAIREKVPGSEIAVTREHDEDVQVALRDAFDAARRQLEDYAREKRGDVKRHVSG